jgi:PmbA protein
MNIIKKALKMGADDVVVESQRGFSKQIRFANNTVTISQLWNILATSIFLTWNNRVVATTIHDSSEKTVNAALRKLMKTVKVVKINKNYYNIAEGPFIYKKITDIFDPRLKELGEKAIDIVDSSINKALEFSEKTAGVFYNTCVERSLETSRGVKAKEEKTNVQINIRAFNAKDESGQAVSCSRTLSKFEPEKAAEKAGTISKLAKNPKHGKTGKFDVVFDPLSIADLLSLVGRFSSAFMVDSGYSFLTDKIGKMVANKKVTVVDDGRMENGFISTQFDSEGYPTQRTPIIENGILKTYLHNTSTAKKFKTKTTGNAGLIAPEPTNTILIPGKHSKEEIFREVKNGLYITNVWYTRFQNYRTGDFSTIPRDGIFLIKNGEIAGSFKNIRVSDNLERMLKNVAAISNKPEWIQWWEVENPVYTPYVLIKNVNITLPTM